MGLVTPNPGTLFWMLLIFGIVVYVLGRFAWKPILNSLKERESGIRDALNSAEQARLQIGNLMAKQDAIRAGAIRDKELILKEAREIRDKMIAEAREKAEREGAKLMAQLREEMENEKIMAITSIKEQIASYSVLIAEKILQEKLEDSLRQENIIQTQLRDFKLN